MKRILSLFLLLALSAGLLCACQRPSHEDTLPVAPEEIPEATEEQEDLSAKEKITIYVVGDSTAQTYQNKNGTVQKASEGKDIMGWPYYLSSYLRKEATVKSIAKSGASSLSYLTSLEYETLKKSLKKGDYLFIQFGHNDEKSAAEQGTDATVSLDEVGDLNVNESGAFSFQAVLYRNYVKPALEVGAIPVLISPVARRSENGQAAITAHLPYQEAMRALAEEMNLCYLDLTEATRAYYESVVQSEGAQGTAKLHSFSDDTRKERDDTHLSHYGAYTVAGLAAEEIRRSIPDLAEYLLKTPKEYKES